MIIINPKRELELPFSATFGMKGFLRLQCIRPDGRVRIDTGWFPNKILDNGRNNMSTQTTWLSHCHVGTGSTPPVAGDTQLENFVVATSTVTSNIDGTEGAAPYFGWRRKTFRYAVGAGHGGQNLSEAGVGWGAAGSTLISRALIIDPATQLPTTVTPLADELLDVTYELRYYPPLIDAINSVVMNGVTYDTTTRASLVTGDIWSDNIGTLIQKLSTGVTQWQVYDGLLGTLEQAPNGNAANIDDYTTVYNRAYSNNSYERKIVAPCGSGGWNLGAGIRSAKVWTTAGAYQCQFDSNPGGSTIPKTSAFTMQLGFTISWTEYV